MKLKKIKIKQKFLELYLLKLRAYEQYNLKLKSTIPNNIDQTLIHFKKALKILFKFHTKNKRILFVGLNGLILKKINKETIHTAIPSRIKLHNAFLNKTKFKNNFKYSLIKLKKNPKLIIILDNMDHYISFIKEINMAKIPTITFGNSFAFKTQTLLYNVPATTEFLLHNRSLFYNCLKFIFKKPKISKHCIKHEKIQKPKTSKHYVKRKKFQKSKTSKHYVKYEKKKI